MNIEPILPGNFYHIYNRGNNRIDIFYENKNYEHFLRLYQKYIIPIAETYAWCLLKNHFHFLVYVKENHEINECEFTYSTVEKAKKIDYSSQFSHFLNAYTQSMNKKHNRTGSLFEKPFKRKLIDNQDYFNRLIYYIHNNPVYHGFETRMIDYPWSSYNGIVNSRPNFINHEKILNHFDGLNNFKNYHKQDQTIFNSLNLNHFV